MDIYTKEECGCYGDSYMGHNHVRQCLASILVEADQQGDDTVSRLLEELEGVMSDDAQEEQDALDIINDELCEDGVEFGFVDGDLMLYRTDGWE